MLAFRSTLRRTGALLSATGHVRNAWQRPRDASPQRGFGSDGASPSQPKETPMKLTDTHLVLLSAAAQREDHAIQLPPDIDSAAAEKLVSKLAGAGLIEEIDAIGDLPVWRRVDDGAFALRITSAGLKAIGVDERDRIASSVREEVVSSPVPARRKKKMAGQAPQTAKARKPRTKRPKGARPKTTRAVKARNSGHTTATRGGTKLDEVRTLLMRKRGATIKEMMDATNWLPHTTRAVLTGLRKRGFGVEREAVKDKPSVYRITSSGATATKTRVRRARAA
ncbi:MAG TPA: DUF3489 domain-containing protein [Burkholderiales bacterium]|nr:DUF3489 domain-containing protein [Burkholderiales bacterium]